MKNSIEYLDAAKNALNIESDYSFAQWIGTTRQTVNNWRKGRQIIDDYAASRIAEALGIDPMEVIAAANWEREKDEKRKSYWRQVGARCAAACLVAGFLRIETNGLQTQKHDTVPIMRNRKRRAMARMRQAKDLLKRTRRQRQHGEETQEIRVSPA